MFVISTETADSNEHEILRDDFLWGADGFRPEKFRVPQTFCRKIEKNAYIVMVIYMVPPLFYFEVGIIARKGVV